MKNTDSRSSPSVFLTLLKEKTNDLRVPFDLNIARFFYYFLFLNKIWNEIYYRTNAIYSYQLVSQEMWTPVGLFYFYPKEFLLSWNEIYIIHLLFCITLFLCMIGFYTKFFSIAAALLSVFCLGYVNNHGNIFSSSTLPVVILFVLAFSNMGSSYSIQNFLNFRKKKEVRSKNIDIFWNQATLKLISTLLFLFYFTSGIQKIRLSGLDWLKSETMSLGLFEMNHPFGELLLQFPLIILALGLSTIALQLSCILPIFLPRLIPYYAVVLFFGFHIALDITMTNHFSIYTYTFIFLIPWTRCYAYLSRIKLDLLKNYSLMSLFHKDLLKQIRTYLKLSGISAILFLSILAPILKKNLYPFSRTTMYAYPEQYVEGKFVRRFMFKIDKNNKKTKINLIEFSPISKYQIQSLFENLHRNGDVDKIKEFAAALKLKQPFFKRSGLKTLEGYTKISVEICFWKDAFLYIKQKGKDPEKCEIITRVDI